MSVNNFIQYLKGTIAFAVQSSSKLRFPTTPHVLKNNIFLNALNAKIEIISFLNALHVSSEVFFGLSYNPSHG